MSWSTSELRVRLAPLNQFKPSSKIFNWPFQGGTSFVDLYVFVLSCVCYVFVLCGHLLGKGWPLGSRLWCLLWVCHFPIGILGQVWYLIVSIPDLCTLTYIDKTSTYAGIVSYLEQNGVHPTAVNIFRYRRDDKLAAWINPPLNEIAIIESLDFPWPTNITFKPWFTKPQLYRETLKQSDTVFKAKPHLYNPKPNCHKDRFQKNQRNSRYNNENSEYYAYRRDDNETNEKRKMHQLTITEMKVWLIKTHFEANTHIITNRTEISTRTDIKHLYLTIAFALTFSGKAMKTNLNIIHVTWNVRGTIS